MTPSSCLLRKLNQMSTNLTNDIESVAKILISNKLTIAFAESATAGRACAEFAMACDAGKFLKGGFVCYDASLKSDVLNVPQQMIEIYTPESMEVTAAIAEGLNQLIPADLYMGLRDYLVPAGVKQKKNPLERCLCMPFFMERNYLQNVRYLAAHITKL